MQVEVDGAEAGLAYVGGGRDQQQMWRDAVQTEERLDEQFEALQRRSDDELHLSLSTREWCPCLSSNHKSNQI
jgi:hypothetical protein